MRWILVAVLVCCGGCKKPVADSPAPAFEPIRSPAPGDWLDRHPEPGQTYDEFVASGPNIPNATRKTIYVVVLGTLGDSSPDVAALNELAQIYYGLEVATLDPIPIADIGATVRGEQLLAPDILDFLETKLPEDAFTLIALTETDLYPDPTWNYVFGMARLEERVAVHSFARYYEDADEVLVKRRAMKILVHELGHTFGLAHCVYYECVLNGSNHLAETDARPIHACPICLKKLEHSIKFKKKDRYEALAAFYEKHGLADEARWTTARAQEID